MNKPLLIFDFDGTIADSLEVAVEIMNEVGVGFDIPKIDVEILHEIKSKKISDLLQMAGLAWWDLPVFLRKARRAFKDRIAEVQPICGMVELIQTLDQQSYTMGILTSNSEENVRIFLKNNNIDCFEFIKTPRSIFGKSKVLKAILKQYGIQASQALMIGDEERDVKAAKKCDVPVVAVSWGFNDVDLLRKQQPTFLAHTADELLSIIQKKGSLS